jgi:hypothetical protein
MASFAEITAVAIYDNMVKVAANEAIILLVVLSKALYAPPFKGRAPTTSPYIFRKRKRTNETISKVIHAYCPAKAIAKAETYKTEELMSLPQIAVASNSFSFLNIFVFIYV